MDFLDVVGKVLSVAPASSPGWGQSVGSRLFDWGFDKTGKAIINSVTSGSSDIYYNVDDQGNKVYKMSPAEEEKSIEEQTKLIDEYKKVPARIFKRGKKWMWQRGNAVREISEGIVDGPGKTSSYVEALCPYNHLGNYGKTPCRYPREPNIDDESIGWRTKFDIIKQGKYQWRPAKILKIYDDGTLDVQIIERVRVPWGKYRKQWERYSLREGRAPETVLYEEGWGRRGAATGKPPWLLRNGTKVWWNPAGAPERARKGAINDEGMPISTTTENITKPGFQDQGHRTFGDAPREDGKFVQPDDGEQYLMGKWWKVQIKNSVEDSEGRRFYTIQQDPTKGWQKWDTNLENGARWS